MYFSSIKIFPSSSQEGDYEIYDPDCFDNHVMDKCLCGNKNGKYCIGEIC